MRAALAAHERVKAQRAHVRRLEARHATRRSRRCRSSSSPSSGSRTTSSWPPSWHERARAPPLPRRPPGVEAAAAAVLGRADGRRRVVVFVIGAAAARGCLIPLVLGVAATIGDPAAALGALALGHQRRGHRHPARDARDQPHARAVDPRPARRHPPRALRAGLRALDGRRAHRRGQPHDPAAARRRRPTSCARGSPGLARTEEEEDASPLSEPTPSLTSGACTRRRSSSTPPTRCATPRSRCS